MYCLKGKLKQSKVFVHQNFKYYKTSGTELAVGIAYCAFRSEKCTAKISLLQNGEYELEGEHTCSQKNQEVDYVLKAKAENKILHLCRTTSRKKSEIFKEVCER